MACKVFLRYILQHLYLLIPVNSFHCMICHILSSKRDKLSGLYLYWCPPTMVISFSLTRLNRLNFSFSETLFET